MRLLVYGAGPLGRLSAARLQEGGPDATLLARGERLADLRRHGFVLHDVQTDQLIDPLNANLAACKQGHCPT